MEYFSVALTLVALVGVVSLFWREIGPGSGRKLGNRVAAHIGIPKTVFYALLANDVKGSSRELLLSLQKSKLSLEEASIRLGPSLRRGLERLEGRFGRQESYEQAKPIIARLLAESERDGVAGTGN